MGNKRIHQDSASDRSLQMFDAVSRGDAKGVMAAIELGAEVNQLFQNDFTALHVAAHFGSIEIVSMLCAAGANVNAPTCIGDSPLTFVIANNGPIDVVEVLQCHGADLSIANALQATPLHFAFAFSNWGVVNLLLWGGADPTRKDCLGRMPAALAPVGLPRETSLLLRAAMKRFSRTGHRS